MERVTGIGGIFFKSSNPKQLSAWYRDHLGISPDADGVVVFRWQSTGVPENHGSTVWAPFASSSTYFAPSSAPFMINYRVDNLECMLAQLRAAGARVDDQIEISQYGRFGWCLDPEGNKFELWEPPARL